DPVAPGKALAELGGPELPRRPTAYEYCVRRLPAADLRAHDVLPPRSAEASLLLALPVARSRDDVAPDLPPVFEQRQALLRNRDFNSRHCAAPRRIPRAAGPPRSRERRPSRSCGD